MLAPKKTLNEIYLNTWALSIEIDTNQFFILENIACQNPMEGGSAVYGARIMIGLNYECSNGANRSQWVEEEMTGLTEENYFSIYPNPSNGLFAIVNNYDELENGKIQILDITGKVIAEFILNSIDETLIDISSLSEGLYNYLVYSNEELIHSDKLIILK